MFFFILYVTFFFFVKNNNIAVARCPYLGSYIQLFYQALKHWTFFWWRLLCWRPGNLRKKKKKKKIWLQTRFHMAYIDRVLQGFPRLLKGIADKEEH